MAEEVRQSLSLKRKIEIIDYVVQNPGKQRQQIATELSVPASTLSKIIKDKQKYLQQYKTSKNPDMKHNRGPKLASVDTELLNWFAAIRKAGVYKLLAHVNAGKSAKDFKPSLLDAVCVLKQSWDKVTPATIANSFGKAGFIKSDGADDTLDDHNPKDHEEQEPLLARLFAEWNIDPSENVSVDDDVATEEPATCASAPSTSTDTVDEEASDEEDNCGKGLERISTNSALDCVEKLKKFCLQSGCSDDIMNYLPE
ncbi:hypothetical protein ACOMHN_044516 [Nucella lapillus]